MNGSGGWSPLSSVTAERIRDSVRPERLRELVRLNRPRPPAGGPRTKPQILWGRVRPHVLAALPAWVIARFLVLVGWLIAHFGAGDHVNTLHGLFAWDGSWYRQIATTGYTSSNYGCRPGLQSAFLCKNLRFFPLYPLLGRWFGALLLGNTGLALILLANIPALGLAALAHHLCLSETGDRTFARRVAWFMALTPPAFVLVLGYSEALSLAAAMVVILCARRQQWWAVAAAGFIGGLLRPVGLLLTVPVAWEALHVKGRKDLGPRLAAVAAPLAATGVYLLWVWARFGNALLPYSVQNIPMLRGHTDNPVTVVIRALAAVTTGHVGHQGHEITVLVLVVLVLLCWSRWPTAYALFATVSVGAALAAQYLGSLERYGFDAFPLVFVAAGLFRSEKANRIVLVLFGAGMIAYVAAAFWGAYVP